ncbi:hypothetical protein C0Q70_15168 [Pomacea canaliculata]|uniref:UspA domain-containing protein n=1 Tax=Pomacea canaliculata TaxID=400727 RepID=A0A2T7NU51_POMCA|nr:hypothetical protein C0Q70_15168 [Pomacea canaliculata]
MHLSIRQNILGLHSRQASNPLQGQPLRSPVLHVKTYLPAIVTTAGNGKTYRGHDKRTYTVMSSDPAMISRMIHQEEEEVNSIVSKIKDKLTQHGVKGKLLRLSGEAGHSIVKTAEMEGVSCIVTGTRGQGKVRRTLLGSVSDYILNHAHVPVLICRHKEVAGSSDSQ